VVIPTGWMQTLTGGDGVVCAAFEAVPAPIEDMVWLRARTDLDLASEPAARIQLRAARAEAAPGATVVLEIGAGYFIDVRGLTLLLDAHRDVRSRGGQLVVLSPSRELRRLVQILDLGADIELVATMEEMRLRRGLGWLPEAERGSR
jgi:anti-anti-sigma factor